MEGEVDQHLLLTLCLIENFGCTRSADNDILYHCFIDNCIYETANLGEHLGHFDNHKEKWSGYCHACNVQVCDKAELLVFEVQHWNKCHKWENKNVMKILVEPNDKWNKLQAAVNTTRARRLVENEDDALMGFDDKFEICLKPWDHPKTLKNEENCRKMLNSKICLYALYKCMDINCSFFTSCADRMSTHLQCHDENHTATQFEKSAWLQCAYCDRIGHSSTSLVEHISRRHSSSIYQCPYCFYRSCSAYNVVFHSEKFHKPRPKSVLVCYGKNLLHTPEEAVIKANRSENVFPLRCTEVCNQITYVMDHFINHIQSTTTRHDHHNFKCQFCGSNIPISEATSHLLGHNIGVYQCIYCIYGANDIDSIHYHMSHMHPTVFPFICVRLTRKNRLLSDDELASVGSTMIAYLSQNIEAKWIERCPFTNEQLINNPEVPTVSSGCSPQLIAFNDWYSNDESPEYDVLTYEDLKRDYSSDDWNQYFAMRLPAHRTFKCNESDIEMASPSPPDNKCETTVPHSTDEIAFQQMTHRTGLEGHSECDLWNEKMDNVRVTCDYAIEAKINEIDLPAEVNRGDVQNVNSINESDPLSVTQNGLEDGGDSTQSSTIGKKKDKIAKKGRKGTGGSVKERIIKPTELTLTDIFWCRCAYCPELFKKPDPVYNHWKRKHEKPNAPFMFQLTKIFQCYHCRHCNTYANLKSHCAQKHSSETFAMIDKVNRLKIFSADETIGQLESYLTDEWLEKIIAEETPVRIDDKILYACPSCPASKCNNQLDVVGHIRKHFLQFQCSICENRFEGIEMLNKHHTIAHAKNDEKSTNVHYRFVDVNENLDKYLEMKIIFPNGLALTKRECTNTKFGAIDEMIEMVEEMNAIDLVAVQKRQIGTNVTKPKAKKAKIDNERTAFKPNVLPKKIASEPCRGQGAVEKENISSQYTLRVASRSNRMDRKK